MPSASQLFDYSQAALASYAIGLQAGLNNVAAYTTDKVNMSASQAARINATWVVLQQSAENANGFSAVLLQRRDAQGNATGEKVLAIAGTDPSSPADLITDIVNIAQYGTALGMPQYLALDTFYAQLVASGKLGASEQIVVTGHSLGGFLTQAFTARHGNVVSAAYTYNAPGFGSFEALLGFFGITNTSAAAKITNIHATDGLSLTAGLGTLLGASQGVRIEADTANPLNNHSVVRLGDGLAVYAAYAGLQPGLSTSQIDPLFISAGNRERRLEDALDSLRTVLIGATSNDSNKTPTDSRDAFYSNLYALQNSATYKSMVGQVQLVAGSVAFAALAEGTTGAALAYRFALLELLPVAVVANTSLQNQTLYGAYAQSLSVFDETTGQGELTKQWLADRSAMLGALVLRNQQNVADEVGGGTGLRPVQYADAASGLQFQVGFNNPLADKPQIRFGGTGADAVNGKSLADHLYGGAGNDVLNGLGGNDYLEGNADNDSLSGGDGSDSLLGGAGADTLDGGLGSDTLLGGDGIDGYKFSGLFGTDTINDSGGQGSIDVAGLGLLTGTGAKKISASDWQSADRSVTYSLVNLGAGKQNLIITVVAGTGTQGAIVINNWSNGQLGISLGSQAPVVNATTTFLGDFIKKKNGSQYVLDAQYNYVSDGAQANTADNIIGTAGADLMKGLGGNDLLTGGDGDDVIEGGAGADLLNGGLGNDTLIGGLGADTYIVGANADLDLVLTSDAADRLSLAGRLLTGASTMQAITDGVSVWTDTSVPASVVLHVFNAARVELTVAGSGSTVIVKDFASGELGITVPVVGAPPVAPKLPGSGSTGTSCSTTYRATAHTVIDVTALGALTTTASGTYGEAWGNGKLLGNASDNVILGGGGADTLDGGVGKDYLGRRSANDAIFWQEQRA